MFEGYRKAFWGVFFMTFHINIGMIPLLPASIGCLILYSGIGQVEEASGRNMSQPSNMALLLAATYVVGYFTNPPWFWSGPVIAGITGLFEMMLFGSLLFHSADILQEQNMVEDAESYKSKARGYVIVFTIITVCIVVSTSFDQTRLSAASIILALIMRVWVMVSVSGLKGLFPEIAPPADSTDEL